MIQAGKLKYVLTFEAETRSKSPTGAVARTYVPVLTVRAEKLKSNTIVIKSDVNAHELFDVSNLIFKIRSYPAINERMHVAYEGVKYRIKLIDHNREERSITLTLEKLNE